MAEVVLRIEELVAGYVRAAPVVRGASLELEGGELLALFGPNGAGKSTLAKAVAGVAPVFSGRVVYAGENLVGMPPHRIARLGIGYVPQVANVFTELTVHENLALARAMRRRQGPSIEDMTALFPELERFARYPAGRLSGGQRQMVAIARALLGGPEVLILDEPSAGLSPGNVALVFQRLKQLTAHVSIVLVEQNVHAALAIADRGALLVEGTVRLVRPAGELLADRTVVAAFLGAAFRRTGH
jgi:branched-chain amino acid transport system ATP-binding protein